MVMRRGLVVETVAPNGKVYRYTVTRTAGNIAWIAPHVKRLGTPDSLSIHRRWWDRYTEVN